MADNYPSLSRHNKHVQKTGSVEENVEYLSSDKGTVMLLICVECHWITGVCEHEKNSWNLDGTTLTCNLCGIDGT